ncbi:MAG: S49 family peptidase [Planctomycetia bacterium]|nr:S49 family peptidase [Planctomycetia bacterium]
MTVPLQNLLAIAPGYAQTLATALSGIRPEELARASQFLPAVSATIQRGVAVIPINGPIGRGQFMNLVEGCDIDRLTDAIRDAADNDAVRAILFDVYSPGGAVEGLATACDEVRRAASRKRVEAHVSDLCASAAFMVVSQCHRISASRMSLCGSIGTRWVLLDCSEMLAKAGVKVIDLNTSPLKSAGDPMVPFTEAHGKYFGGLVETFFSDFVKTVAAGRKMSEQAVLGLADGQLHVASEAVTLRLIDAVDTFPSVLSRLQAGETSFKIRSENQMIDNSTARPATLAELRESVPNMDATFYLAQLESNATILQAQADAIAMLQQRAAAAGGAPKRHGVKTLEEHVGAGVRDASVGAVAEFGDQVAERMRAGLGRRDAVRAVAGAHPELHAAYVASTNPNTRRVQDLVAERFA